MAIVVIPDKICNRCGSTSWYTYNKNAKHKMYTTHVCVSCKQVANRKYFQSENGKLHSRESKTQARSTISDAYIRNLDRAHGGDASGLTPEDYETYRTGILIQRKQRQIIKKAKAMTITATLTKEEKKEAAKIKARESSRNYYHANKEEIVRKQKERNAILKNKKLLNKATLAVIAEESAFAGDFRQRRIENLSDVERLQIAYSSIHSIKKEADGNLSKAGKREKVNEKIHTHVELAKIANVSNSTAQRYIYVINEGSEDVKARMHSGQITISGAEESVRKSKLDIESAIPVVAEIKPPMFIQMLNKLLKEKTALLEKTQKEVEAIHVLLNI